jgi:hypothetical protein
VNAKFVPVLFGKTPIAHIPTILAAATYYVLPEGYEALYARLTGQPMYHKEPLGRIRRIEPAVPSVVHDTALSSVTATFRQQHRIRQRLANAAAVINLESEPHLSLLAEPECPLDLSAFFRAPQNPLFAELQNPPSLRDGGFGLHNPKAHFQPTAQMAERGRVFRVSRPGVRVLELWRDATLLFVTGADYFTLRDDIGPGELNPLALTEQVYLFVELSKRVNKLADSPKGNFKVMLQLNRLETESRRLSLSPKYVGSQELPVVLESHLAPDTDLAIDLTASMFQRSDRIAYDWLADLYGAFGFPPQVMPYTREDQGEWVVDVERIRQ